MPSVQVRILKKTQPHLTGGASVQSPSYLTSGAATLSWSGAEVNTAALPDTIIISELLPSATPRKPSHRVSSKASRSGVKFDMMPAYVARHQPAAPISLQAVNTPLAAKVQEEMSDFERDYPW